MAEQTKKDQGPLGLGQVMEALPTDALMQQARNLAAAAGERAVAAATDKIAGTTSRLADYAERGGGRPGDRGDGEGGGTSPMRLMLAAGAAGVKQMVGNKLTGGGGGGGGKGGKLKVTNIVEETEVGVPVRVAYNQWTQFQDFPRFTKRLESVEQKSDEKLAWKAGIFLSHRSWESSIIEQVPDELIVWRSKGDKGYVDGTVTFHELTPNLTKILLVLEYHPQGLVERMGNLWRAQGRRTRLELKHFRRHVMTHTILDPDSVEGWRGEIRDGDVVRSHEDAMEEEGAEDDYDEGEGEDENEDEDAADEDWEDESPEGADDEEEPEEGSEDEPEDYDDEEEAEGYDEDDEDDYDEDDYGDAEDEEDAENEEDAEDEESDTGGRTASRSRGRAPARAR